ncbi:MAG: serine--tRNA ligase [Hyphomicrobiaceae bacterium]|nr:serine--tRNA ligase [Hyphomicrobiaceae bacterium]MCC0008698.1 serine--tRNA ligase [Hyphomicrobiaceae bacterium]
MFDIKWIRDNAETFDAGLKRRGLAPLSAKLIELDDARRRHQTKLQDAQSRRNAASKEIGKAMGAKDTATADKLKVEVAELKEFLQGAEEEERQLVAALNDALSVIPNLPLADVVDGKDEHDNKEVRRWGEPKKFDFAVKQHFELGEALGLMDFETAAKVSGARFVFLKGALSRLERAIASFMIDQHTGPAGEGRGGYTEYNPPLLVKDHTAYGTGNLPKFAEDLFATSRKASREAAAEAVEFTRQKWGLKSLLDLKAEMTEKFIQEADSKRAEIDRLWLIPTAEVSLTNIVREEIIDADKLPMRMTAWTPCFRSEAGAAGKDTRGMIRQHQFSKVELVSITKPDDSIAEHERMTACAQGILEKLGLPYRTMMLCTGDMGFASQRTYDIEVWLPGQDTYREISSCSVCGDFQARRMNARYRAGEKDVRFVHTLNGSGLAVGRTLVAVMENYQQADGSIVVPDALKPYMNGIEVIR